MILQLGNVLHLDDGVAISCSFILLARLAIADGITLDLCLIRKAYRLFSSSIFSFGRVVFVFQLANLRFPFVCVFVIGSW